jgi:hypothetical protein
MKSLASSIQIRVSYVVEVVLYRMCSRAYKYAFCTSRALSIDIVLYRMCSVYKYAFRTLRACNSIEHTNSHGGSCDVSSYRWSVFLFFPCSLIINIKKFFFRRSSVEDGGWWWWWWWWWWWSFYDSVWHTHTHTHTHTRGVSTGYCQNNWKININLSILFLVKKEKIKGRIFTGYCLWALCWFWRAKTEPNWSNGESRDRDHRGSFPDT